MEMKKASWWRPLEAGRVECELCPRRCRLEEGRAGFCRVRKNSGGQLVTLVHGQTTGFAVDPIEKKPLYHFLPGSNILSFGTVGCNLGCRFCQNWHLSRGDPNEVEGRWVTPAQVVELALRQGCPSIAFTYNEPTIFGEFVIETASLARSRGLRTVMVTAGYVEPGARTEIYRDIDAANVDLKSFRDSFYKEQCAARLEPVLATLEWLVKERKCWVEVTNLLIPGLNDSVEEIQDLCAWIHDRLGSDLPLHFSAFHPDHLLDNHPPTGVETLKTAAEIAHSAGLRYVYLGNVHTAAGQDTACPECGMKIIARSGFQARLEPGLKGICPGCGNAIPGVFS